MATIGELTNLSSLLPGHDERIFRRGELYYVDLEGVEYASRYVQRKTRPGLIIQNNIGNEKTQTVIVALATSQFKKDYPFQYRTKINGDNCIIKYDQIMTLDKFRILEYIDTLPEAEMEQADKALMYSLGLSRFSLENILGFDTESKITKETRTGVKVFFTFHFDLQHGGVVKLQVPLEALHEYDPAITATSSIDSVRKATDTCQGLHWIVTHKEYIVL